MQIVPITIMLNQHGFREITPAFTRASTKNAPQRIWKSMKDIRRKASFDNRSAGQKRRRNYDN